MEFCDDQEFIRAHTYLRVFARMCVCVCVCAHARVIFCMYVFMTTLVFFYLKQRLLHR